MYRGRVAAEVPIPRRNRVTPLGELIADPARGLVHGNRGCLHDDQGRIRRRYGGRRWIACRLEFKGWRRSPLMQPGRYTELFFLDEATAFAAGHRPCALCRREDFERFGEIWRRLHARQIGADEIDAQPHVERIDPGTRNQRHHRAPMESLPDGVFILLEDTPHLILGDCLLRWTPGGYVAARTRPFVTRAEVVTPPSLVDVLRRGWDPQVPFLHPSALASAGRR